MSERDLKDRCLQQARCNLCLENFSAEKKPKFLRCHHITCLDCLQVRLICHVPLFLNQPPRFLNEHLSKTQITVSEGWVDCPQCNKTNWIAMDTPLPPALNHDNHDELADRDPINGPPPVSDVYKRAQLDSQLVTADIALDFAMYLAHIQRETSMSASGPSGENRECADEEMSSCSESEDTDSDEEDSDDSTDEEAPYCKFLKHFLCPSCNLQFILFYGIIIWFPIPFIYSTSTDGSKRKLNTSFPSSVNKKLRAELIGKKGKSLNKTSSAVFKQKGKFKNFGH